MIRRRHGPVATLPLARNAEDTTLFFETVRSCVHKALVVTPRSLNRVPLPF